MHSSDISRDNISLHIWMINTDGWTLSERQTLRRIACSAVRIVFFSFRIESNSYRWSQKSPVVSTC